MRRTILVFAAVPALLAAAGASAHVEVTPDQIAAQELSRLTIKVENERSNAQTVKVVVKLPTKLIVVRYDPKAGWKRSATTTALTKPLKIDGRTIRRRASLVTWIATTRQARFGPGEASGTFGLRAVARAKPGETLAFPTLQTYSNGEVVRWIGSPSAEEPAPRVKVR